VKALVLWRKLLSDGTAVQVVTWTDRKGIEGRSIEICPPGDSSLATEAPGECAPFELRTPEDLRILTLAMSDVYRGEIPPFVAFPRQ
jgi:hypothetical protein